MMIKEPDQKITDLSWYRKNVAICHFFGGGLQKMNDNKEFLNDV